MLSTSCTAPLCRLELFHPLANACALTAPAAPATRSLRRPPVPAQHPLRLRAPSYLRPCPAPCSPALRPLPPCFVVPPQHARGCAAPTPHVLPACPSGRTPLRSHPAPRFPLAHEPPPPALRPPLPALCSRRGSPSPPHLAPSQCPRPQFACTPRLAPAFRATIRPTACARPCASSAPRAPASPSHLPLVSPAPALEHPHLAPRALPSPHPLARTPRFARTRASAPPPRFAPAPARTPRFAYIPGSPALSLRPRAPRALAFRPCATHASPRRNLCASPQLSICAPLCPVPARTSAPALCLHPALRPHSRIDLAPPAHSRLDSRCPHLASPQPSARASPQLSALAPLRPSPSLCTRASFCTRAVPHLASPQPSARNSLRPSTLPLFSCTFPRARGRSVRFGRGGVGHQ